MQAHKVVEYLLEQVRLAKDPFMRSFSKWTFAHDELFNQLASDIKAAQKFDFSSVPFRVYPLKEMEEDGLSEEILTNIRNRLKEDPDALCCHPPRITDKEADWFRRDLIPLPSALCWYEITVPPYDYNEEKPTHVGILLRKKAHEWITHTFTLNDNLGTGSAISMAPFIGEWELSENGVPMKEMREYYMPYGFQIGQRYNKETIATITSVFFYLTLMFNSRSTTIEKIEPPVKINKKRIKNGKIPIDRYNKVVIVPKEFLKRTDGTGEGSPKGIHVCRSHIRHYENQTPNSKWVADMEYLGKTGWWVVIIPEHFRGKAELGTITHDYIVR